MAEKQELSLEEAIKLARGVRDWRETRDTLFSSGYLGIVRNIDSMGNNLEINLRKNFLFTKKLWLSCDLGINASGTSRPLVEYIGTRNKDLSKIYDRVEAHFRSGREVSYQNTLRNTRRLLGG